MNQFKPHLSEMLICHFDRALKTLMPGSNSSASSNPGLLIEEPELTEQERKQVAGFMRVNHTGEVCAQALYKGQSLTAKLPQVYQSMEIAADEEIDHLVWCEQRIKELDSHTSYLNPFWYASSYLLGATAGIVGDKYSLGFVAATENQVCKHLQDHIDKINEIDPKSTAIIQQMLEDEARHSNAAIAAGGVRFPDSIEQIMTQVSKLMTKTTFHL